MWTVKISSQAGRLQASLPTKERQRVAAAFDLLREDPRSGKSLKGDLKGYWSYRVGMYRMLYRIEASEVTVYVLRIQHRKEVYERFRG